MKYKTCIWWNIGGGVNSYLASCEKEGLTTETAASHTRMPDVGEPCPLCGRPVNPNKMYHPNTVLAQYRKKYSNF
jgi:DNA repair exonuclease SbcCD ATPase subunit